MVQLWVILWAEIHHRWRALAELLIRNMVSYCKFPKTAWETITMTSIWNTRPNHLYITVLFISFCSVKTFLEQKLTFIPLTCITRLKAKNHWIRTHKRFRALCQSISLSPSSGQSQKHPSLSCASETPVMKELTSSLRQYSQRINLVFIFIS